MNLEGRSQTHSNNLRDKNITSPLKLPYLKPSESLSVINSYDEPLNVQGRSSFSAKSAMMKSEDKNDRTNTVIKRPEHIEPFALLEEEGERYLREHFILPPIEECSGIKYYINIAQKDGDLSSSNSVKDWWDLPDYDKECCVGSRAEKDKYKEQEHLEELTDGENVCKKNNFPITKKTKLERKQNDHNTQEYIRTQIISDLEKRMLSLHSLKKHYKRNIYSELCGKESLSLPPIIGNDWLTRQRDSIINRIRMKKKESDLKHRKQLDRKLEIVQKILNEQQRNKSNKKYVGSKSSKLVKRTSNEYKDLENKRAEEHREEKIVEEEKVSFSDSAITKQNKESIVGNILSKDGDFLSDGPVAKLVSEEIQESVVVLKASKKGTTSKKEKKKKSLQGTEKADRKIDKKKKIAKDTAETAAATCETAPELPANEMPDLLLWFENWRENKREETQRLQEIESKKLTIETKVLLQPSSVTFEDVRSGRVSRRQVTVTNTGEEALRCSVADIIYPPDYSHTSLIKAELDGPSKATSGRFWTLTLSLEAVEEVEESSVEVRLEFGRADDSRRQLSVWVNVLTPRADPSLSHSCLRFGSQVFWNTTPVTKLLTVSNHGARGCVMHWTKHNYSNHQLFRVPPTIYDEHDDADNDGTLVAREVLEACFAEVFAVFRLDARQNLFLPPKSHVVLPVQFIPAMSEDKGDVFCKYTFTFVGEKVTNPLQDLVVCGKIEDTAFKLKPDMLDMKVCYVGGNVQQAEFYVVSSARHVCSVSASVPRALAQQVCVVPRETIVQAHSSVCLALRIVLRWSFLEDGSPYLDIDSGLLDFPVLVTVRTREVLVAPPLELRVLALVATPCPLSVTPSCLDLGHVTTQETVSADLYITNHHHSCAYQFAFLHLPQSVLVEPGGGCGVVLPQETLLLQLLFSPSPQDIGVACGRPGGAGHVVLSLRCFTTPSLACPLPRQNKSGHSASSDDKRVLSTRKLSHIGDCGSGDMTYSSDSTSRTYVEHFDNLSEVESGEVSGGGDFDDELTVEESQLSITSDVHAEKSVFDDSVSLKTNDVWDYFSSYEIGSLKNGIEIVQHITQNLVDDEGHDEQNTDSVHTDSIPVTKIGMEEGIYLTTDENLIENGRASEGSEGILRSLDNNNATLVPLYKHNLDLFEHEGDGYQHPSNQRYASVSIRAYVTDPLVELSSQIVVLPPTPCQSYSVASIHIRSKYQKKCKIHIKNTKFKTQFELKSDSGELSVEPRRGSVQYDQSTKLTLIFRPVLHQREIYEKALEMKMEAIKLKKVRELLDLYYQSKEKKLKIMSTARSLKGSLKRKKKAESDKTKSEKKVKNKTGLSIPKDKKRSTRSVVSRKTTKTTKLSVGSKNLKGKDSGPLPEVVVDPAEVEVTQEDLWQAEVWLLKYLEPHTKHITLLCTLLTTMDTGERREESLMCQVVCPVVAPTLVLCSPPCLQFGPTALGTSARLNICVTNVSFLDVPVHLSTLNPRGALTCPFALETPYSMDGEGVELPPEHTLNIPILFQPFSTGKELERFEVVSSNTILHLQAMGEGVVPSFTFSPDQAAFTLTHAAKKKSEVIISIENTCAAPLRFSFRQEFLKEGFSLPSSTAKHSPTSSPEGGSKKTLKTKPVDKKNKVKQEITTWTPELVSCLNNEFTDLSTDEMWFTIIDYDKHIDIRAGEVKNVTIRFTPQVNVKSRPESVITKSSRQKSSRVNSKSPVKRKKGSKIYKTEANKKEKQGNRSPAEYKMKDETVPSMRVIATKFTVLLAGVKEVKDWLFIGVIKE